jgi:hypothetical protein
MHSGPQPTFSIVNCSMACCAIMLLVSSIIRTCTGTPKLTNIDCLILHLLTLQHIISDSHHVYDN